MEKNARVINTPKYFSDLTRMEQKFLLFYRQLDRVKQIEIKAKLKVYEITSSGIRSNK